MPQKVKNPQLLYQTADFILELQVVDSGRKKLFKAKVNIMDKVAITKVFSLLKLKFNLSIPKDLKEEVNNQSAWDELSLG